MTSIAASAGQVVFIPKDSNSYFYESFPCIKAYSSGYSGIQFSVQGPAGGSLALELQTGASCEAEGWKSSYNIVSGLTGSRQTVTVPLIGFDNEPNYDAVKGLVWAVFSQTGTQWSIGNITLLCGGTPVGPTQPSQPTAPVLPSTSMRRVSSTASGKG